MRPERKAIFPGSFDPITKGHESVIRRAIPLFEKIIIAIGINTTKQYYFPLEDRVKYLEKVFEGEPGIEIDTYQKLTVEYCREKKAKYLIRGLRNTDDFIYEKNIAHMNHQLAPEIETVFFLTDPQFAAINASIVREIHRNNGNIKPFIPEVLDI